MTILFTKTSIKAEVRQQLPNYSLEFVDVILTKILEIEPFNFIADYLVFTSVNGVQSFLKNGFSFNGNSVLVVGKKTQDFLQQNGIGSKCFLNAAELKQYLEQLENPGKIVHFCSTIATEILPKNWIEEKIRAYETVLLYPKIEENYGAVCFFSPSGVRSFAKFNSFDGKIIFAIGETTASEIKNFTQINPITAENTLDSILEEIRQNITV